MGEKTEDKTAEARKEYYRDYYSKNKDKYKQANAKYWKNKAKTAGGGDVEE